MKPNGKFATLVVFLIVVVGTVLLSSHAYAQSDVSRGDSKDALEGTFVVTVTFDGGGSSVVRRLFTRDGKVVALSHSPRSPYSSGTIGLNPAVQTRLSHTGWGQALDGMRCYLAPLSSLHGWAAAHGHFVSGF